MRCEYCCDSCNGYFLMHPSPHKVIIADKCETHGLCIYQGWLKDRYDCIMLQALNGVDY